MTTVGIRDLKARLSEYVGRAAAGESIFLTDRGKPVAMLSPLPAGILALESLKSKGRLRWEGGKPKGIPAGKLRSRRKANPDVSGAIVEDRQR